MIDRLASSVYPRDMNCKSERFRFQSPATWLILGLLLGAMPLGTVCAADDKADRQTLKDLYEATQQWSRQIDASLQYHFRDGSCDSKDAGLAGKFGSQANPPTDEEVCTGTIARRLSQIRFSRHLEGEPETIEIDEEVHVTLPAWQDESANEIIHMIHQPAPEPLGPLLIVTRRISEEDSPLRPIMIHGIPHGFSMAMNPFKGIGDDLETISKRLKRVVRDEDHIALVFSWEPGPDLLMTSVLHFRTDFSPAVVDRIDNSEANYAVGMGTVSEMAASEFVTCGELMIATKINFTSNTMRPGQDRPASWIAQEWTASNVVSPAADSDFFVPILPKTKVVGITNADRFQGLPFADPSRIDASDLTVDDTPVIDFPDAEMLSLHASMTDDPGEYRWTPAIGITCMVGLAIAILAIHLRSVR